VQIERIAVALRPRNAWESLDLGFRMAREWWRPLWGVWLALYLPVAAIVLAAIPNKGIAVLVLWWLKPLFDRAVLYAASRAVFGESCGVAATLRAARDWLRPGLLGALTFGRFDFARSFTLPVATLEKQTWGAAVKRRRALGARTRGNAVWLTVVCAHIEWVALFATFFIVAMLEPSAAEFVPEPEDDAFGALGPFLAWTLRDGLHYVLAVCLVEPFYVTAGFALYLNRRTILEGWDIEVQLRRLEARLSTAARAAAVLLCAGVLAAAMALPQPAHAEDDKSPQDTIEKILATPEFSTERQVERWKYIGSGSNTERKPRSLQFSEALHNFILFLSDMSQALLWIVAVLLLVAVLYAARRFLPEAQPRLRKGRAPDVLFGLEVAPESLPDDIAAAALSAAQAGRLREALSLLYRGALSSLVHRFGVTLRPGDTEGDCERAARGALPAEASQYFASLVAAWQHAAYAGRPPALAGIESMCRQWSAHFAQREPA
jgi:hypothetical protein